MVLALPKLSSMGFAYNIFVSMDGWTVEASLELSDGALLFVVEERYWMILLVFSVLPAPLSPVTKIDWSFLLARRFLKVFSAVAKI